MRTAILKTHLPEEVQKVIEAKKFPDTFVPFMLDTFLRTLMRDKTDPHILFDREAFEARLLAFFKLPHSEEFAKRHDYEWFPESHWEDHPDWPVAGWVYEVDEGDTRLGYVDWVNSKIEQEKAA